MTNEKLTENLNDTEVLYYRLGVNTDLDDKIIREIARMRSLNRKPINPQTIVDPATARIVEHLDQLCTKSRTGRVLSRTGRVLSRTGRVLSRTGRVFELQRSSLIPAQGLYPG